MAQNLLRGSLGDVAFQRVEPLQRGGDIGEGVIGEPHMPHDGNRRRSGRKGGLPTERFTNVTLHRVAAPSPEKLDDGQFDSSARVELGSLPPKGMFSNTNVE